MVLPSSCTRSPLPSSGTRPLLMAAMLTAAAVAGCGGESPEPAPADVQGELPEDDATATAIDADLPEDVVAPSDAEALTDTLGPQDVAETSDQPELPDPDNPYPSNPYPAPGDWPPNTGPGAPAVPFEEADLRVNCAFLDGGPKDFADHHNLVVMFDGYLMLPWAPESGEGGLTFFDISAPCTPTTVGMGTSSNMRETHSAGFGHIGDRWFTVTDSINLDEFDFDVGFRCGVQLWDVTDVTAPVEVSMLDLPGAGYPDSYTRLTLSTAFQAPYIYVAGADNGVYVVDASDPTDPQHVMTLAFEPTFRAGMVSAVGNLLIVGSAEEARTILLDISRPGQPQPIPGGDFDLVDPDGIFHEPYFNNIGGGYIWYARKSPHGGLFIVDIHDPTQPTWLSEAWSFGSGGYVFIKDDIAFMGESDFASMYDVSDPAAPVWLMEETFDLTGDLDTATPIGNVLVLSVDAKANLNEATAIAPYATAPDTKGPTVTWVWPPDGAMDLEPTSRFGVTFSEMVAPRSAWEGSVRLYETGTDPAHTRVDGWFSVQENTVNFFPKTPLQPGATYTFEIPQGGVADLNGNATTAPFSASYTIVGG